MNSPFVYGKIAAESSFTDRELETASLTRDFLNLTNTVLISPRRWGKSSLVRKSGDAAERTDPKLKMCYIDIFNIRNEDEFYEKFAASLLKAVAGKADELFAAARKYASMLVPAFVVGDMANQVRMEFQIKRSSRNADEILDLAERIAIDKKIRIVVCIDEFQRLAEFKDSDALQARLRSHWQLHQHVAYCLYGSQRHMMTEVFTDREKPFYKFGKTIFLEKIEAGKWIEFIQTKFRETGRDISDGLCRDIVEMVDNNPYYIQQLCEETWNRTEPSHDATAEAVSIAFESIVQSQAALNLSLTQTLTEMQQNLLHAIVDGQKELTAAAVIENYNLKNSITVQRAKKALSQKDIIDTFGKTVTMEDPVYAWWLKHVYFNRAEY